ncbi:hypothetical protein WJX73_009539 [Symbiochloris irregularis]|uniref:Uncharacterized protein n=1 Tax=Symbiochloris irregularis TaxID=706552 RepID=A0AAW1NVD0_9CHLO
MQITSLRCPRCQSHRGPAQPLPYRPSSVRSLQHRRSQLSPRADAQSARTEDAGDSSVILTKRRFLQGLTAAAVTAEGWAAHAAQQKPDKLKNLPIDQLTARLKKALVQDNYYVSGKVPREIFADDCVFSDPTQRTPGIDWYSKAVPTLFNPDKSKVDVIDIYPRDDKKSIYLEWRLEAFLNVPGFRWAQIKPYTGHTIYTTNADGLINTQQESWDIGIIDCFVSTFVPSYGAPPAPPIDELLKQRQA